MHGIFVSGSKYELQNKWRRSKLRKFIVVDGLDGTTCELNEKEIKDLAVYYYENSDDVEEVDFKTNPISDAIKYIERVDKVTEIE